MPKVIRSIGVPIRVGNMTTGYFAGGGYQGKTKELDDTVAQAAQLLSLEFSRDVEIRFNSDRESGGAWLKNSLEGFSANCQVGLCAGIYKVCPGDWSQEDMLNAACDHSWPHSQQRIRYDNLPTEIKINTYVAQSALTDKRLATEGHCYCLQHHDSIELAIYWLRVNVDRTAIAE